MRPNLKIQGWKPDIVAYTFKPNTWRSMDKQISEIEASLGQNKFQAKKSLHPGKVDSQNSGHTGTQISHF